MDRRRAIRSLIGVKRRRCGKGYRAVSAAGASIMLKVAILVWLMLGITLAGIAMMIVLGVPALNAQGMQLIPIAAGIGALLAIPAALLIAKRIMALGAPKA